MTLLRSAVGAIFSVLLTCSVFAQSNTCEWQISKAPTWVRSPIQMDIHAGYRMFGFKSDGTVGYRVRGAFPFAAFLSFATYNIADPFLYDVLLDYKIEPDQNSTNPFREDQLVNAPDRSYTVTVLPAGTATDDSMPNPIFYPVPPRGSELVDIVLVERVYLAEPQIHDRFAEASPPVIEPFDVRDPAVQASCPTDDISAIADQVESMGPNFQHSPLPIDGKINFYRPPAEQVPFADGSEQLTSHDCTSYLMATVFPDKLAIIHFTAMPSFFDNTNITPTTTFENKEVRYLSIGAYGASVLTAKQNENIAGPDIKKFADGSATFIAVPIGLPRSVQSAVKERADQLGYNVLPLSEEGRMIYPFLIYRNKVPAPGFVGNINKVACYQGPGFSSAPLSFAASPKDMGQFAPTGIECSPSEFLAGRCGQ